MQLSRDQRKTFNLLMQVNVSPLHPKSDAVPSELHVQRDKQRHLRGSYLVCVLHISMISNVRSVLRQGRKREMAHFQFSQQWWKWERCKEITFLLLLCQNQSVYKTRHSYENGFHLLHKSNSISVEKFHVITHFTRQKATQKWPIDLKSPTDALADHKDTVSSYLTGKANSWLHFE